MAQVKCGETPDEEIYVYFLSKVNLIHDDVKIL